MSTDTRTLVRAVDVQVGNLLDLERDPYIDPNGDGSCPEPGCEDHYTAYEYEAALVEDIHTEGTVGPSHPIVVLSTTLGTFAVPHDHKLRRIA